VLTSKSESLGWNPSTLSDEHLVALYLGAETAPEEKERIRAELCERYYPYLNSKPEGRPYRGHSFKKRVYALLSLYGGARWMDEYGEECCSYTFERLFMHVTGFHNLLSKFKPQGRGSPNSFRYWVINLRVRAVVIDWLRKQPKYPAPIPIDEAFPREQGPFGEEVLAIEPQEDGPWMWWDAFLRPRHGTVIHLLHLAYHNVNEYYLKQIASESGKTEEDVRAEVSLLQQRLRPTKRFGDSEGMEIYALKQMMEAEELKLLAQDVQLDEATLEAIISSVTRRTRAKFSGRPPIKEQALREMFSETFGGQPAVVDLKKVLRRWIDFLDGELLEGKLFELKQEMGRREQAVRRDKKHLHRLGLDDLEIAALEQSAKALTLQKLKSLQEATVKEREWIERAYQEQWLRLDNVKRKRDRVLAGYRSSEYLVKPRQREMVGIMDLPMGTIGGRIGKARHALNGAVIWREILDELAKLDVIAHHQDRLNWLRMTCVISFEDKVLKIGIPEVGEVLWRDLLLPWVKVILQKPPVHGTVQRYEQTGMKVMITNYKGRWPPQAQELVDQVLAPASHYQSEE